MTVGDVTAATASRAPRRTGSRWSTRNGDWQWRRFGDLRAGDRVPLMLGGMVGEPREVALPAAPRGVLDLGPSDVRARATMTADLAELVGYFMGDGSLHASGLRFCVDGERRRRRRPDLVDLGRRLFGLEAAVAAKAGYTEVALPLGPPDPVVGGVRLRQARPERASTAARATRLTFPDAVLYTQRCRRLSRLRAGSVRGRRQRQQRLCVVLDGVGAASAARSRRCCWRSGSSTTRKVDQPTLGHRGANPDPRPAAPQRQLGRPVPGGDRRSSPSAKRTSHPARPTTDRRHATTTCR